MILELLEDRVKRGKTREWLKERAEKGMFQTVITLSLQDTPAFKEIMRMSPDQFKEILNATEPDIQYANRAPKWMVNQLFPLKGEL